MKNCVALFLVIVCMLSLLGCERNQLKDEFPVLQPTAFSEYLDEENFIPELGQGKFIDQMSKYTQAGTPISEMLMGYHYDGPYGGGYNASGEYFGFSNDYTATENGKYATYSNKFYTTVSLDGLTLPYGITFDDTVATVLEKFDVNIDPQIDFVSDKANEGTMTLQTGESSSLVLINCLLLPGLSGKPLYDFELRYTEKYHTTRRDGRGTNVTRSVILSFLDENYKLGKFDVSVVEEYKIN